MYFLLYGLNSLVKWYDLEDDDDIKLAFQI